MVSGGLRCTRKWGLSNRLAGVLQACAAATLVQAGGVLLRADAAPPPLLAEEGGGIRGVVVHAVPDAPFADTVFRDFFRTLRSDATVWAVCQKPEHAERLARLIGRDVIPVPVGRPITTWSRDRFAAAADGSIAIPPDPPAANSERSNDRLAPPMLARARGVRLRTAPFAFDGGDFTAADGRLIATSAWAERNSGLAPAELARRAERFFGQPLVYLPDAPRHHVGMVLAPVGGRTILVGDARWGARLAPDGLDIDDREETAQRFDGVAEALSREGFRVERIPVLPTRREYVWMTYTNGLVERGAVWMPTYGHALLDDAAAAAYARLGFEVRRVDASGAYVRGGTLHCLVHVVERG